MGVIKRSIGQPLLQEATSHNAMSGVKVLATASLFIGLCMVVLISSESGTKQDSSVAMFNRIQPRSASSNNFLSARGQSGPRRFPLARVQAEPQVLENTWQARLDKALLNLDVEPQERLSLLQEAFRDPVLSEDLRSAVGILQDKGFGKGHPEVIEKLWPKGTTARADLEGLTALRKQVPEVLQDVQNQVQQSPRSFFPLQSSTGAAPPLPDLASVFGSLQTLVTDTEKQREIIEETKDLLRSTPKGLETPDYDVVRTIDGPLFLGTPEVIELRKYESFIVARTNVQDAGFTSRSGATGFNTLASYLFGNNEAKQGMKMTMPVEMTMSNSDEQGSMAFVLPRKDASAPPKPLAGSNVTLQNVPARLVAAKPFPGIVTDEEVQRQKIALLEAIAADGSVTPVDENQVIVLQYNSPLTVPWRRRNEVTMVVTENIMKNMDDTKQTEVQSEADDKTQEDVESKKEIPKVVN
jgi:hypothetical protein